MSPAQHSRRPGFTFVELLVVIALIAVLLALSASATVRVIDVQRGSNTEQTVKIVSEQLDRQWQIVVDEVMRPGAVVPSNVQSALQPIVGNDPFRMRLFYLKLKLQQEFPMTFNEARAPRLLPPIRAYANALPATGSPGQPLESSVCLLLALQQSRGGTTFDADRLGSGAISEASGLSGLKCIVDGFANPIAFFRWPTGNRELNPPDGLDGHKDPTDPEGLLTNTDWMRTVTPPAYQWFRNNIHPLPPLQPPPPAPQRIRSYKVMPVVASAGRNGQFNLNDNMGLINAASEDANDNIYSYRLRFGARGD